MVPQWSNQGHDLRVALQGHDPKLFLSGQVKISWLGATEALVTYGKPLVRWAEKYTVVSGHSQESGLSWKWSHVNVHVQMGRWHS